MINMKKFHERLQYVATIKKKIQADLVADLSKNSAAVSRWWNGTVVPGNKSTMMLADYFGCDLGWLSTGEGEPFPGQQVEKRAKEGNSPAQAAGTNGLILGGDVWQKRRTSDRQPTATQENLRWIVEWMNKYYGEHPSQSMYLYEDLKDRYPSFREFVEKKRASGDPQAGLPGELSVNDKG